MKLTWNKRLRLIFCFLSADCYGEIPSRSIIFASFRIGNPYIAEQMIKSAPENGRFLIKMHIEEMIPP
ncbi:hypothetical protein B4071_1908 [Bacillus subtilis]|nr:hypothetical protein BsLM_1971 [Bacillus sp. LM 4-2]KIN39698.1 hypothetical protein B4071_1908 [Bacillus subtilis]NDK03980.1 hypothetical protein [Bacillus subtilis subsp. subtilis]